MSDLKVKGLGENNVPEVKGLNKVDVTAVPTPTPKPVAETVDVTAMPTQTPVVEPQKLDVTAVPVSTNTQSSIDYTQTPTVNQTAAPKIDVTQTPTMAQQNVQKIDYTQTPTVGGNGNQNVNYSQMPAAGQQQSSGMDYKVIIFIALGGILIIALIIIIVTSLGGKKLVCTHSSSSEFKSENKVIFKFDGDDKVKSISHNEFADFSTYDSFGSVGDEEFKTYIDKQANSLREEYDNVNVSVNGKTVTVTYDEKEEDVKKHTKNYEDTKKYYEQLEFTCK